MDKGIWEESLTIHLGLVKANAPYIPEPVAVKNEPVLRPAAVKKPVGRPQMHWSVAGSSTSRKKPCSVEGCNTPYYKGGLCGKHGGVSRCRHEGCPKQAQAGGLCIGHGGGKPCTIVGCTVRAKGAWCSKHTPRTIGTKMRRRKNPVVKDNTAAAGARFCNTRGCSRVVKGNDTLCSNHSGDNRKPCSVEGCMMLAAGRDLCGRHWEGRLCSTALCTKYALSGGLCLAHDGGLPVDVLAMAPTSTTPVGDAGAAAHAVTNPHVMTTRRKGVRGPSVLLAAASMPELEPQPQPAQLEPEPAQSQPEPAQPEPAQLEPEPAQLEPAEPEPEPAQLEPAEPEPEPADVGTMG